MNEALDDSLAKIQRLPNRGRWKLLFRIAVGVVVGAALVWTIIKASRDVQDLDFQLREIRLMPLAAAVGLYACVMLLAGIFWHRLLIATGASVPLGRSLLAFFSSQLGKYVPGKAMVVIVRTSMVNDHGAETSSAAATVFMETLTWIFVGSAIGSLMLCWMIDGLPLLRYGALGLAVASGVLTWPPMFRRIAGRLVKRRELLDGVTWRVLLSGWALMAVGWSLNGLCLWLVLFSLPVADLSLAEFSWADYRLCLACVTLATVAGFLSLLPGGLGVRELVMIPLLSPRFGVGVALTAAVLLRFVWLTAELSTSGIIYAWQRGAVKADSDG